MAERRGIYYLRPSPECLGPNSDILIHSSIPHSLYHTYFNDISNMTMRDISICRLYHPETLHIADLLKIAESSLNESTGCGSETKQSANCDVGDLGYCIVNDVQDPGIIPIPGTRPDVDSSYIFSQRQQRF